MKNKLLLSSLVAAIAVTAFLAIRPMSNQKNIDINSSSAATTPTTGTVAQTGAPEVEVVRFHVEPVLK